MANLQATTVDGILVSLRTENVQTGNYTLALTDRDKVVAMNNTAAVTVTIPTNLSVAFPIGSVVYINRVNTGSVTLAAAGGVTVSRTGLFGVKESIECRKRDTNEWIVVDQANNLTATGGTTSTPSVGVTAHTYTATGAGSFVVS
jgi:hypothetical protein